MHVIANDIYVSRSLALYGEWCAEEADLLRQIVRPGWVVVEAGANIGAHSLFLARACAPGRLLCFEPQPRVAQLLSANLAMNGCANAAVQTCALGAEPGWAHIPNLEFGKPANIGGAELTVVDGDAAAAGAVRVPVARLDDLGLPNLNFLKADVEGSELHVLQGAQGLIARHRPVMYVENDRRDKSAALISYIAGLGYRLFRHKAPMYRAKNFNRNPRNVFGAGACVNMLCVPCESPAKIQGLERIETGA